ncbi:MAG: hypothetical protein IT472_11375 [Thermomonas sp.]|uniref:hypothetical protein n=1 Tax=Thermomonas sp. TaxID=1971895 RepID=UPI0026319570|nr:hypothetical protein [Thermomonas sp.]MCC7097769.1 hypothetical protein [Thermomonas sp.]
MKRTVYACGLALGLLGPTLANPPAEDAGPVASNTAQGAIAMTRWSIDAGGTTSAIGGNFRLGASIGQPEAALASGGPYRLNAGFWVPESAGDGLFANGFE